MKANKDHFELYNKVKRFLGYLKVSPTEDRKKELELTQQELYGGKQRSFEKLFSEGKEPEEIETIDKDFSDKVSKFLETIGEEQERTGFFVGQYTELVNNKENKKSKEDMCHILRECKKIMEKRGFNKKDERATDDFTMNYNYLKGLRLS